ncbi:MAG TPA: hypothetical protein VGN44_14340 [Candidatus Angelobacter sp.]|jgi:hypothetical protein
MKTIKSQLTSAGQQSISFPSDAVLKKRHSEIGNFMHTAQPCREEAAPIPIYSAPIFSFSGIAYVPALRGNHSVKVKLNT